MMRSRVEYSVPLVLLLVGLGALMSITAVVLILTSGGPIYYPAIYWATVKAVGPWRCYWLLDSLPQVWRACQVLNAALFVIFGRLLWKLHADGILRRWVQGARSELREMESRP